MDAVDKVRFNLWLSPRMYRYLEALGAQDQRSMSDLVRQALDEFMQRHPILTEDSHGTSSGVARELAQPIPTHGV
jgi:hypothetical protein